MLTFTGLRFCRASALKWEDIDEEQAIINVRRKQYRGHVGPVSRRKRAPRELPLDPYVAEALREHRKMLVASRGPGLGEGWIFPSEKGTLWTPGSLRKAWDGCLKEIGVTERFTVHGLRLTFTDLTRRVGADKVVRRSLTGHLTEAMQRHYESVGMDEKRAAISGAVRLVLGGGGGDRGGDCGRKAG